MGAQVFNSTTTKLHTFHDSILAAKILLLILAKGNSSECSRQGLISLFPLTNERGGEGVDGGENVVLIVFILVPGDGDHDDVGESCLHSVHYKPLSDMTPPQTPPNTSHEVSGSQSPGNRLLSI